MPKIAELPKNLRAYQFHGVMLEYRDGSDQAVGDCPFCGKDGKFYVGIEAGLWDCKVCKTGTEKGGGNIYTFLRKLWEASSTDGMDQLAANRNLLSTDTLIKWGVVRSPLNGNWMVPGYGVNGKINQMYRYIKDRESGKFRLLATPELPHGIFGLNLFEAGKPNIYLCEGPWDGAALWETMSKVKQVEGSEDKVAPTSSLASSLLSTTNVLAVPGCGVFAESWAPLFRNKSVSLLYDNDHPRKHNNQVIEGAGPAGMRRVSGLLAKAEMPPDEIKYLKWGENGCDLTVPSGTDLRDVIGKYDKPLERGEALMGLLSKVETIPQEWVGLAASNKKGHIGEIDCTFCDNWETLVNSWRKALKWTEGLDRALSVMLACTASTKAVGDQLWVKIIGPAACGKSTLCEALSVNKKYVLAKSTIRGFHSGFKTDRGGEEDHSLISIVSGKTLVTKDGDTLLQAPNLPQILAEARDLYDSTSRTHYRHGLKRDYEGIRMTWLLCGTSSLRSIDSSELGERFLDCVIMESIDDDLEDLILLRKANQADRCMSFESDGKMETQHDPALVEAMQLTGGYVTYLRENARNLLDQVKIEEYALTKCIHLAKFVAYMRARPSTKQEENAERELATRLTSQIVRLAKSLAIVLNRKTVDKEVLRRVTRVAKDTARGRTSEIIKYLYKAGDDGIETRPLAIYTNQTEDSERKLLRFLRRIGAVEAFNKKERGLSSRPRWKLTKRIIKLYEEVNSDELEKKPEEPNNAASTNGRKV